MIKIKVGFLKKLLEEHGDDADFLLFYTSKKKGLKTVGVGKAAEKLIEIDLKERTIGN